MSSARPHRRSLLDELLPDYDANEVHSITTSAPPAAAMEAIRAIRVREVPLMVVLMGIRTLPALIRGRRPATGRLLDGFQRSGFVALCETPGEVVYGVVGRFWTLDGGLRPIAAEEFAGFAEPGWAKGAFNFEVARNGTETVIRTETRVAATDESARRSFRRYWRVVHPGSALIRLAWLRAIRRRAERHAS